MVQHSVVSTFANVTRSFAGTFATFIWVLMSYAVTTVMVLLGKPRLYSIHSNEFIAFSWGMRLAHINFAFKLRVDTSLRVEHSSFLGMTSKSHID